MKILAVDVGTGTQDIFLFDSRQTIENGYKMVLPSPTMMVRKSIQEATLRGSALLLDGVTMGGGPCSWAVEDHLKIGYKVYATVDAARTIHDNLEIVKALGVVIVSEEEAHRLPDEVVRIITGDFVFDKIRAAFTQFGVDLNGLSAVSVAVFDHGEAPAGVSDRKFRFDYLDERIHCCNRLSAFAYQADDIPPFLTRMLAVAQSARSIPAPLVVMDTAPAAVLGALLDPNVISKKELLVCNMGNFHTLAFRIGLGGIDGLFEHHTGILNQSKLESLIRGLADGTLTCQEVFSDQGHGALVYSQQALKLDLPGSLVLTGPRRSLLAESRLNPYCAAPFGDMMITGCFGLLRAMADLMPQFHDELIDSLAGKKRKTINPWE